MSDELFRPEVERARARDRFSTTLMPRPFRTRWLVGFAAVAIGLLAVVFHAPWHAAFHYAGTATIADACGGAATVPCLTARVLGASGLAARLGPDSAVYVDSNTRGAPASCRFHGTVRHVEPARRESGRRERAHPDGQAWAAIVRLHRARPDTCVAGTLVRIQVLERVSLAGRAARPE